MELFPKTNYKKVSLFKNVKKSEWNNWKWQFANTIKNIPALKQVIDLDENDETDLRLCLKKFKMGITPYYASLMDKQYNRCAIRLQAVPTIEELKDRSCNHHSLYKDMDSPVDGIKHRSPDTALFFVTYICPVFCRYCTQNRLVGFKDKYLHKGMMNKCIEYIECRKQIRNVLISGGDPLSLEDLILENILKRLREIKHVKIIRIESRMPVVLPQRITDSFAGMLKKYHPIYFNTQFNHPKEITYESQQACATLADAGIPLGNQTVLLKDINDCPFIMKKLMHKLLMIRVKPYYIYQCDSTTGTSHFSTSIAKGMEIMENLHGHTSGLAVPTFVVEAPDGGGKVPVIPNYILS